MHRWLVSLLVLVLASCQSVRQEPALQADHPGLDVLAGRVAESREALQATAQQFQSARNQLSELTAANGLAVQAAVAATRRHYDDSVNAAATVGAANAAVGEEASRVFREWQIEVDVYTDAQLKADSQAKLRATTQSYQSLLQALRQAEAGIDSVLAAFNDVVISLNDNPDPGAVASGVSEITVLQREIDGLLHNLSNAIASCDAFIQSIE